MDQIEKKVYSFVNDYMDYLKQINNNFKLNIYTSDDFESRRDNAGWYQYINGHIINLNILNMTCAANFIANGLLDVDSFFAFITLVVGHEYRHFLQGSVIYDNKELEGFTRHDAVAAHLMMYIRYFFDAYYLLNKGNVKYEVDAELFGVMEGAKFLSHYNPSIDAKDSIKNAANFYADLIARGFGKPTLPRKSSSYDELVRKLSININDNKRDNDLRSTLQVFLKSFYSTHGYYGLDENLLITNDLMQNYAKLENGFDKDLLIANRILNLLEKPEESLEQFTRIKNFYDGKKLVIK